MLQETDIQKYIAIHEKLYGSSLSTDQAKADLTALLSLVQLVFESKRENYEK